MLRGEDLLSSHPAPDRALRGAESSSASAAGHAAVRPPAVRHGRGQQEALQARPARRTCSTYRERGFLPEGLLNYLALLGWSIAADRDVFSMRRDGRGVRHRGRQPQPGPLRPQEVRGDQRRAHPAAAARGDGRRVLPFLQRCRPASPTRRPPRTARVLARGDAAGRRADEQAHRGRRHAVVPARRRGRLRARADDGRRRRAQPVVQAAYDALAALPEWTTAADRRGAARRARRGARAQAAAGLRRRCGSRSPAAGSRRRSSSASSCSAASGRWRGCARSLG